MDSAGAAQVQPPPSQQGGRSGAGDGSPVVVGASPWQAGAIFDSLWFPWVSKTCAHAMGLPRTFRINASVTIHRMERVLLTSGSLRAGGAIFKPSERAM